MLVGQVLQRRRFKIHSKRVFLARIAKLNGWSTFASNPHLHSSSFEPKHHEKCTKNVGKCGSPGELSRRVGDAEDGQVRLKIVSDHYLVSEKLADFIDKLVVVLLVLNLLDFNAVVPSAHVDDIRRGWKAELVLIFFCRVQISTCWNFTENCSTMTIDDCRSHKQLLLPKYELK